MSVPAALVVSPAASLDAAILDQLEVLQRDDPLRDIDIAAAGSTLWQGPALSEYLYLTLFLLHERRQGNNHDGSSSTGSTAAERRPWAGWLTATNTSSDATGGQPLFWLDADQDRDPELWAAERLLPAAAREKARAMSRTIAAMYRHVQPVLGGAMSQGGAVAVTLAEFRAAWSFVHSYSFFSARLRSTVLVPVADLFNHASRHCANYAKDDESFYGDSARAVGGVPAASPPSPAEATPASGGENFVVRADQDYEAGEEVRICYSPTHSSQLLTQWGFVEPLLLQPGAGKRNLNLNPADYLEIPLGLAVLDVDFALRSEVLEYHRVLCGRTRTGRPPAAANSGGGGGLRLRIYPGGKARVSGGNLTALLWAKTAEIDEIRNIIVRGNTPNEANTTDATVGSSHLVCQTAASAFKGNSNSEAEFVLRTLLLWLEREQSSGLTLPVARQEAETYCRRTSSGGSETEGGGTGGGSSGRSPREEDFTCREITLESDGDGFASCLASPPPPPSPSRSTMVGRRALCMAWRLRAKQLQLAHWFVRHAVRGTAQLVGDGESASFSSPASSSSSAGGRRDAPQFSWEDFCIANLQRCERFAALIGPKPAPARVRSARKRADVTKQATT